MSCLVVFEQRPAAPRLYCLPHAGAGSATYAPWSRQLAAEVVGVLPPGRERRRAEPLAETLGTIVDELVAAIAQDDRPFSLFGHSLGALGAFEAARRLEALGRGPRRLIVSGASAPQLARSFNPPADDQAALARLRALGGTPAAILEHAELQALFLPVFRVDMTIAATYALAPGPKLATPLGALGGLADAEVPRPDLLAWREQAAGEFEAAFFPGGHFYLHEAPAAPLAAIARWL